VEPAFCYQKDTLLQVYLKRTATMQQMTSHRGSNRKSQQRWNASQTEQNELQICGLGDSKPVHERVNSQTRIYKFLGGLGLRMRMSAIAAVQQYTRVIGKVC